VLRNTSSLGKDGTVYIQHPYALKDLFVAIEVLLLVYTIMTTHIKIEEWLRKVEVDPEKQLKIKSGVFKEKLYFC